MEEFKYIGKSVPRVDAVAKVTGRAKYGADYEMPGMLWAKVVRSPYPHARILNIDTSRAERLPGVKAVCTGKEFGDFKWGWIHATRDETPLAIDKVRYLGEGVAGIAAIDEETAEEACELVEVDYEELPGVYDPFEAMLEGAPNVHNHVKNNICFEFHMDYGNVEKGFSESYLVRQDKFRTPRIAKGYVEPSAMLAYWDDATGSATLIGTKGSPYFIWRIISGCFKLPLNKVRIIQPFIGNDFGGTKNDCVNGDFCAVMLAKKTGKPVKIIYTMEEELLTCLRRHSINVDIKTGVKRDGTLVATQLHLVADGGAYTRISPLTMYLTGAIHCLPYKLPNFKTDVYCVYTNNPIAAAMRGHGVAHTRFAADTQMDMIAEELGIDPLEIRLRNAIEAPHETINKATVASCGFKECLTEVAKAVNWKERKKAKKVEGNIARGMGIAGAAYLSGTKLSGHMACTCIIKVNEDGSVNLLTGASDVGQGSDTVMTMIAAEVLGIDMKDIELRRVDTALTPVDPGSYGSRVTVHAGTATIKAAESAKRQLLEFAATQFGVKPEDMDIKDGRAFVKSDPSRGMPFGRLARAACFTEPGKVIVGTGQSSFGIEMVDTEKGSGNAGTAYSFAAQEAEVEVDLETGLVRCVDTTIGCDCGRPINPLAVEVQNIGGSAQGLGQALYEDFIMDKGKTLNPSFLDYKRPRAPEAPRAKVIHVVTNDPFGPFGAKEASEGSICTAPPSIINAIHDAAGVWLTQLPAHPEKVLKAIEEKKKKESKK